jgi:hypothetical protein
VALAALMGAFFALFPDLSGLADGSSFCNFIARERLDDLIRIRAIQIQPRRRDSPARYQNISDEEVREIQVAASTVVGKVVVTIGPVVVGCPCEDGKSCTDQVWILANLPQGTVGLLLSKIGGYWDIGAVQRWWLQDATLPRLGLCKAQSECDALTYAWRKHIDDFPKCGLNPKDVAYVSEALSQCNNRHR